jgi:CRP/FNR family cyclic AMP-dependent transcriptional regulator
MNDLIIDFEVLAAVVKETRHYKAGETIFKAGDPGTEFFVVRSGSVSIRVGDRSIETLGPSQVFGEMAMVDAKPRSASVVAETDSIVVPLSEKQFVMLVREAPYFALAVMRVLVQRLRATNAALSGR